jgi:hypothetical protein
MRSARCPYLARITGVAIVTDPTSYVPAAAGSGLRFETSTWRRAGETCSLGGQ